MVEKGTHTSPDTEFKKGHKTWLGKHHTEEAKRKISISHKGLKAGENHPCWGKHRTEETKRKVSEARKGMVFSEEHCKNLSKAKKGKPAAWVNDPVKREQSGKKISISHKGRKLKPHTEDWKTIVSKKLKGRIRSEAQRKKQSETMKGRYCGSKSSGWKGGISFIPYCPKFNNELKERIRDRDDRTCQLCGVKENGRKLTVHHIHYDKPNCEPDLLALCLKCHGVVNTNREKWEAYFMAVLAWRGILFE